MKNNTNKMMEKPVNFSVKMSEEVMYQIEAAKLSTSTKTQQQTNAQLKHTSNNNQEEFSSETQNDSKLINITTGKLTNVLKHVSFGDKKCYTSLFIFSEESSIRKACKYICESKPFEIIIFLAILSNCLLLAMNTPLPNDDSSFINVLLENSEIYMVTIFCVESVLRIISNGFVLHRGSYLRSPWNILDFVVVVTGIISLPELNFNIKASFIKVLRTARVLRPLKLISGIPSLHVIMASIGKALLPLINIGILLLFFILIYAIIGNLLLSGKWLYLCVNLSNNSTILGNLENQICSPVSGGFQCPQGYACLQRNSNHGPSNDAISFNDIFHSMIAVFSCITSEGWTDMLYKSMDAIDVNGRFIWLFYYSINLIGAKFMLNLVLGVLSENFSKERERMLKRHEFKKLRIEQKEPTIFQDYGVCIDKTENNLKKSSHQMITIINSANTNPTNNANSNSIIRSWKQFLVDSKAIRWRIRSLVRHKTFFWISIFIVFLNTLSVSSEHYEQPDWLITIQDYAEISFISFFTLELLLKLFGIGPKKLLQNKFHCFDLVVVIFGLAEIVLVQLKNISLGFSIFRAFKILRLLKYTKHWISLKSLIKSLMNGIKSIISLMFLLLLANVVFALLGMQILGGFFQILQPTPRTNFDDFANSMLVVFQVLTGTNWLDVLIDAINAKQPLIISLYFISMVIVGNYTLLNVFLAIAINNLTSAQEYNIAEKIERMEKEQKINNLRNSFIVQVTGKNKITSEDKSSIEIPEENILQDEFDTDNDTHYTLGSLFKKLKRNDKIITTYVAPPLIQTNTLFCCPTWFPIRRFCHWIINLRHFESMMLVAILASGVVLAAEDPINDSSMVNVVLKYMDYVLTVVFIIEIPLKIIANGLVLHRGAFLRDPWNIIDILVVICSVVSIVLTDFFLGANLIVQRIVKVLKVLRVLRPIKVINRSKKLKAVFDCMIYSLKNVTNILFIAILFLFIYAVMGVQLFKGKFQRCNDINKPKNDCVGNFLILDNIFDLNSVKEYKRVWSDSKYNFNNVFQAMITLFVISTGELWPSVMHMAIDATTPGTSPIYNNNIMASLYFVVFVIIFNFFVLNVFVALIILTFKEREDVGNFEMDRNKKACLQYSMKAKPINRFMPQNPYDLQYKAWKLINSSYFEIIITLMIVGNMIILTLNWYNQPEILSFWFDRINIAFTFIFAVETTLKIYALRLHYFKDSWNVFDLIILFGGLFDFFTFMFYNSSSLPFDPTIFKIFRAVRLVKLLRRGYTIRMLLWTFIQSFKALPYVCALIFMLFFIYAIIGMQLFAKIQRTPKEAINEHTNFATFINALQLLFRVSTGENWEDIMYECVNPKSCLTPNESCGSIIAYFYFVSFIFFCTFLMLNLFIAVIMDNFDYLIQDKSILGTHHLEDFVRLWSYYDPKATGRIKHTEVCQLLRRMPPPLGLGYNCPKVLAYKRLVRMNMPLLNNNDVEFRTTLFALVRTSLNIMTLENNILSNEQELRKMIMRIWPKLTKKTLDSVVPLKHYTNLSTMTIGKIYCAKLIYYNYKLTKINRSTNNTNESMSLMSPVGKISTTLENAFANVMIRNRIQKSEENCTLNVTTTND